MPPFLANVNPSYLYDILRAEFLLEENKKGKLQFGSLVEIWDKRIQRARYEKFLLELASVGLFEYLNLLSSSLTRIIILNIYNTRV